MKLRSSFDLSYHISQPQLNLENPLKYRSQSKSPIKKHSTQNEIYYYIEKNRENDKFIPTLENKQNLSGLVDQEQNVDQTQKKQKIIYLQRDMIKYATENSKKKLTSQLLNNNYKRTSKFLDECYENKNIHFKKDIHMPFANILNSSSQRLSKLIGYEPNSNQNQISMNGRYKDALEKRSIKALTSQVNANKKSTVGQLIPISKDPMKNFNTFFTTKLEYHKKEIEQLNTLKKIDQDELNMRRSDICMKEEKNLKHQLFRNIIIIHINQLKQNAIELLSYRIPYYNQTEQMLKDNFISNSKLMDNLFDYCTEYFSLQYKLKYISLLDETPIQLFQDIPLDQNIIIISNFPKENFWTKYFDSKQMSKPNDRELQKLIMKLNNFKDLSQVENYFKIKKSFITGLDEFLVNSSFYFNKNLQNSQRNTSHDLKQNKHSQFDLHISQNELRKSIYDFATSSQSTTPTPNKLNSQMVLNQNILNSPQNQMVLASFLSPISKKQSNSNNRQDSFSTPQKIQIWNIQKNLPAIKREPQYQKDNSRMRLFEQSLKLKENIVQPYSIQNKNRTSSLHTKSKVQENIDKYTSLNDVMKKKYNLLQDAADVNTILQKTSFDRYQLHLLFSKFKALITYKSKYRNPLKKSPQTIIEEGVDVVSFRRGVDSLLVAPTEQIEKIFQNQNAFISKEQGGMNWEGFIYALDMIEAKTDNAKIDLFMRLLDEDQSGTISYDEIFDQSNQLLRQLYKNQKSDSISVDEISHFLTKTIFDAVGQDYDKEILSEDLKLQIRKQNKDLELLLMLCFYHNDESYNYYTNSDEEDLQEEKEQRLKQQMAESQDLFSN